jgi:hypothetical protein
MSDVWDAATQRIVEREPPFTVLHTSEIGYWPGSFGDDDVHYVRCVNGGSRTIVEGSIVLGVDYGTAERSVITVVGVER